MMPPVVCSIGSTEPWNAAGLGLDISALRDCGVRPVTVVAGVTAQDSAGLSASFALPADIIGAQLESLRDANIAAYRVGALLDAASIDAVGAWLAAAGAPAVYDPVLGPSAGGAFAGPEALAAIVGRLLPRVTLATPNFHEAARLCGSAGVEAGVDAGVDAMEHVGRALLDRGARAVLVTGGDLPGVVRDVLVQPEGTTVFEAPRIPGTMRGTGCLLACGIAAALARGSTLRDAVAAGRAFVRERFARAVRANGTREAY
jgi:hydroxymethylpyrimidine/phosphomethylpyrimidine kinase